MADSDLRGLLAPLMEHRLVAGVAMGILIPPILLWFGLGPYSRLFVAIRAKAVTQPKGSNRRQLLVLLPLLLMTSNLLVGYSYLYLLKWYSRVPSLVRLGTTDSVCVIVYCLSIVTSFSVSVWWLGGLQVFRPLGYDPKNPNPDPDEWRWKNKT
ncbi:hypothetical protein [Candidatus Binatus sp.]|uniref:hypothetical protein n=1 Tax=Candidatus Binatus sp. TaxID=2811406 RepID=UPI003C5393E6